MECSHTTNYAMYRLLGLAIKALDKLTYPL